ncbi:MAG: class I SAM-dependent methyltransferase [Pseudonocardiaceae bacterium]
MGESVSLRSRRVDGYESARPDVQNLVPLGARQILELGCSSGRLGAALKTRQKATITGVELDELYAKDAASRIDHVICASAEDFVAGAAPHGTSFDCLIAADVLEHLVDPWDVLAKAVTMLAPDATVIISLPNVLYWPEFRRLLTERRWPRDDAGIFDRTHLRWFTRGDAIELVEHAGLSLVRVVPSYWARGPRLALRRALARTPLWPFVAAQYLLVARLNDSKNR